MTHRGISIPAIETYCHLVRLRYAGHIARMSKSRIPNIVLHGEVGEGFRNLEDRKKALEKALEMTSKPSNYGQNIQHNFFLIDWLKTEKNGEKQLAQPRKNSRNNGNNQRLIQA